MGNHTHDIPRLEKQITDLSNALAHLGKGESLHELLKVIRFPGYTTPAEFALLVTIVENMAQQTAALNALQGQLLAGAKLVVAHE